ncbi:uncharacterized protein C15orf61 [Calliopsis andreniformis]|uniref:uncharacterized protein C15orf61 n=1 Tax=Calliopsis andreniformis TaxID=337506 RepID=UPI003FCCA98D
MMIRILFTRPNSMWTRSYSGKVKPLASKVLTSYLLQTNEPPWTSYFVKYADVIDDQRGRSCFNWPVGSSNYHILRTGCFPYIKYHCSKKPRRNLNREDQIYWMIKLMNLGLPLLIYGLTAIFLISHQEVVKTPSGDVTIYFLLSENKSSPY